MKNLLFLLLLSFPLSTFPQSSKVSNQLPELEFRSVGPTRGGRVTTVTGVIPRQNEFYMGATGGGVWKTVDYGETWQNVSDGFFATGSIGAIRVAESNPEVVWVGTGSDGIRSNVIIGKGVYRSLDAGKTWEFKGLPESGQIGAVEIHPKNPDVCWVAAIGNPFRNNDQRGVFKTVDGGKSWKKVLYISDSTGVCDLEICPGTPDILYASAWTVLRRPWSIYSGSTEGGIYKSSDGGESWVKLAGGLPTGVIGKSDLAVCRTKPENLYVLVEAADDQGGLYFSDDFGENFRLLSKRSGLLDRPFYYTNLDVDPANPAVIHVNSTGYYKSSDFGITWERRSTPHGDNHDLWIHPDNSDVMIQSNDGGANITQDGGASWSTQMNQPTAELYQVDLDDQFPYWLYAGQQDNSTVAISSAANAGGRRGAVNFIAVGGCETGPAVPKPGNHNLVYANCKGCFGVFDKRTGIEKQYWVGGQSLYGHNPRDLKYRFQRVAPIYVSPHDPDVVYHCSQYVHKTTDDGVNWETISPDLTAFEPDKQVISGAPITRDITGEEYYSTIYAITESPVKKGIIWVGANDGPVHVTIDGGKTWANVTPPDLPPGGRVQTVEASPHDPAKAYFATYRYLLGDFEPYIYRTNDYGKTWTRLTNGKNGIPANWPTRVVREDPVREGLLYAGTEFGLFVSFDDGENWESMQYNLPVVPVTDLKIKTIEVETGQGASGIGKSRRDLVLSTMGRGFWIMDDISPLEQIQMSGELTTTLFKPSTAFRSNDMGVANIDYYLGQDAGQCKLEIFDAKGQLIASPRAAQGAGFHRTEWNMRLAAAAQEEGGFRGRSGGLKLPPGQYTVKLRAGDVVFEETLNIAADPRLTEGGMTQADFEEQFELCLKVQALQNEARAFADQVGTELKALQDKQSSGKKLSKKELARVEELVDLQNRLVTPSITYPQAMLLGQISYLNGLISRVDQKPGRDAWERYEELKEELRRVREGQ